MKADAVKIAYQVWVALWRGFHFCHLLCTVRLVVVACILWRFCLLNFVIRPAILLLD